MRISNKRPRTYPIGFQIIHNFSWLKSTAGGPSHAEHINILLNVKTDTEVMIPIAMGI